MAPFDIKELRDLTAYDELELDTLGEKKIALFVIISDTDATFNFSDIGVTLNIYTHLGLEDAEDELRRLEDLQNARKELERTQGEKPVSQKMFKVI